MIGATGVTLPLDTLTALTAIAIVPFIVVMMTSFVRIVVVLSLVRSAIGAQGLPPNIVITGLAIVLSFLVMTPTLQSVSREALVPYQQHKIGTGEVVGRAIAPLRTFMIRQVSTHDGGFFDRLAGRTDSSIVEAPLSVVLPAFVVGELRRGFAIGFAIYLPFIVIDLVISGILMGLGMFMLSPSVISLPCKLFLFVLVDGWTEVCGSLVTSFR